MEEDAEEGVGSISGVEAMNVRTFTEQGPTQATQQSQSSQAGLSFTGPQASGALQTCQ